MRETDPFHTEGFEAFESGLDYRDCPYDEGTDGEYGWQLGYKAAEAQSDLNRALEAT